MKQSSFRAICLILMACIAVFQAFADRAVAVESHVLESFNNDGTDNSRNWGKASSRFATPSDTRVRAEMDEGERFPRMTWAQTVPDALRHFNEARGRAEVTPENSLGIWGRFDRRGNNWIDIFPLGENADGETVMAPIPIPGRLHAIDMWVWGSNFRYEVEAYFRDYRGMIHTISLGMIDHVGWRNLRADIPARIPQTIPQAPFLQPLEFVKFRIWTTPTERVDNFYIYFSQFRALIDFFEAPYDGEVLTRPDFINDVWGGE